MANMSLSTINTLYNIAQQRTSTVEGQQQMSGEEIMDEMEDMM